VANHKSAFKRIKQNEKRRLRNKGIRTTVRRVTKVARATASTSPEKMGEVLKNAIKTIDKAASKGIIPKRRASRKISRLMKLANTVAV